MEQARNVKNIGITVSKINVLDVKTIIEERVDEVLLKSKGKYDSIWFKDAIAANFSIALDGKPIHTLDGAEFTIDISQNEKTHKEGKYYRTFIVSENGTVDTTVAKIKYGEAHVPTSYFSTIVVTTVECTPFIDVEPGQWYTDSVIFAFENKIMGGVGNCLFNKSAYMTRAMLVTMLYNLSGMPDLTNAKNPFVDVATGQWYEYAVKWAYANKIVCGVDGTHYAPDKLITREELVTMLYNYVKISGKVPVKLTDLSLFDDVNTISLWAYDAFKWANSVKIVEGYGSELMPGATATRVEGAELFMKFMNNIQ